MNAIESEHERYNRLVELNVQEQCINVIKLASVQQEYLENGFPTVHGWVFDIGTGKIKDLNLNFPELLKGIQEIYNLTGSKSSV